MRVLLIEDDKMVGSAVEQALKDAAYAVDWVTDGETAIHAAENEAYEVALLDLGLPMADGREVLRRFRALGRKLPVIIVTARDGVDDRIDGLDLGALLHGPQLPELEGPPVAADPRLPVEDPARRRARASGRRTRRGPLAGSRRVHECDRQFISLCSGDWKLPLEYLKVSAHRPTCPQ